MVIEELLNRITFTHIEIKVKHWVIAYKGIDTQNLVTVVSHNNIHRIIRWYPSYFNRAPETLRERWYYNGNKKGI